MEEVHQLGFAAADPVRIKLDDWEVSPGIQGITRRQTARVRGIRRGLGGGGVDTPGAGDPSASCRTAGGGDEPAPPVGEQSWQRQTDRAVSGAPRRPAHEMWANRPQQQRKGRLSPRLAIVLEQT